MWLVPQLTAFHQSQAEKSIPLDNTFGFRQLREQRLEKCGLCSITLHFSRPLIGGRQATVVYIYIYVCMYVCVCVCVYVYVCVFMYVQCSTNVLDPFMLEQLKHPE